MLSAYTAYEASKPKKKPASNSAKTSFKMRRWSVLLLLLAAGTLYPADANDRRENYIDEDPDKPSEPSADYNDKVAEIFDVPFENNPARLNKCAHVICVPYYLCINNAVVVNGTDLFEWRTSGTESAGLHFDRTKASLLCDDLEMPCCADNVYASIVDPANEPGDDDEVIALPTTLPSAPTPQPARFVPAPSIGQCGVQFNRRRVRTRAIQGESTEPMEFPWVVGIFKRSPAGKLVYLGGGSIIHMNAVLTAAHFLAHMHAGDLLIRAGVHDILERHVDGQQLRNISRLVIHEELYSRALINDVALLVFDEPLEWSRSVTPICLPPQNWETPIGHECTASGWGKHLTGQPGQYQRQMKKIALPVVELKQCQRILRTTRLGPYFRVHPSLICAGGSGTDTCKGDGGSPLVCPIPALSYRYYQCGIVAGGVGCGGKLPAMYVDVSIFVGWIKHQLWLFNLAIDQSHTLPHTLYDGM